MKCQSYQIIATFCLILKEKEKSVVINLFEHKMTKLCKIT